MRRKANFKLFNKVLPVMWFLSTTGYYLIMLFMFQIGFSAQSRLFTIPVKLIPMTLGIWILYKYKSVFHRNKLLGFTWLILSFFYLLRMFYDLNFEDELFFMSPSNYFMFAISHFVLPPLYMSVRFSDKSWEISKYYILFGGILVSIFGFYFYKDLFYLSEFGRLKSDDESEIILSPLAISYVSVIPLSYFSFQLFNYESIKNFILNFLGIALSLPGLLMGSSRGSILAFVMVIILLAYLKGYRLKLLIFSVGIILLFPLILVLSSGFGSSLFDRVIATFKSSQSGEYLNEDRPYLFKNAIKNFIDKPIFGDLIENRGIGHHPHNVIIESFMAMGIIGGILLLSLLIILFYMTSVIAKKTNKFDWVIIVFFISFSMSMVSGAIWSSIWLWTSSGSIMGIYYNNLQIKRNV